MKNLLLTLGFLVWTLLCIYGTYWNTVDNAEPKRVGNVYEITYHNTGETHIYN